MSGARDLSEHCPLHSPARPASIILTLAALVLSLWAGVIHAATEAAPREQLSLPIDSAMIPWTGDLDAASRSAAHPSADGLQQDFYFVDRGGPARHDLRFSVCSRKI